MSKELFNQNDNELLYLIAQDSEEALEIMYKKYENLIKSRISKFNIPKDLYEDYFQEGQLMLHKAIATYNPKTTKTFNKYFDLILQNQFITLLRKQNNYNKNLILVDTEFVDAKASQQTLHEDLEIETDSLSKFEQTVYQMRFITNASIGEIANALAVSEKKIYNAIQRIKTKLR